MLRQWEILSTLHTGKHMSTAETEGRGLWNSCVRQRHCRTSNGTVCSRPTFTGDKQGSISVAATCQHSLGRIQGPALSPVSALWPGPWGKGQESLCDLEALGAHVRPQHEPLNHDPASGPQWPGIRPGTGPCSHLPQEPETVAAYRPSGSVEGPMNDEVCRKVETMTADPRSPSFLELPPCRC